MEYLDIYENDEMLDMFLAGEKMRRIQFEANPSESVKIITEITGNKYKIYENGRIWDNDNPCVNCSQEECFDCLKELSQTAPVKYESPNGFSNCNNHLNEGLLTMLCNWRKHIKNTFIIENPAGTDKWKKISICTSELTFLSRRTEIGGIIGIVAATEKHINSLPTLASLMEKEEGLHVGVKCLSAGFVMMITMYMGWDIYTQENKEIIGKLLKKIRKNGVVGVDTYEGSPWCKMFHCVLERKKIPDKLREFILSRAHLP